MFEVLTNFGFVYVFIVEFIAINDISQDLQKRYHKIQNRPL